MCLTPSARLEKGVRGARPPGKSPPPQRSTSELILWGIFTLLLDIHPDICHPILDFASPFSWGQLRPGSGESSGVIPLPCAQALPWAHMGH